MRLLIPTGLFYPSKLGGPANTLYWLAKALVQNDIDVTVVTSDNFIDEGLVKSNKWTDVDGVRVRYCTAKTKLPFRVIHHSILEVFKADVVLFSSLCYLPNFFILLFAFILGKKIVWSPRGELFDSALQGNKGKLFYFRVIRLFFRKGHLFHATSEEEKQAIRKHFGDKYRVVIIPNYMELPKKLERDNNKDKYLLFLGRIAPIKAIDNLLLGVTKSEAFLNSSYKLILAGIKQGDYYLELESILDNNPEIKDKVEFIGSIEGREKYQLYANAEYTILVSHSENFGNVIIESLSQGTPVLASYGTPWQILETTNSGYWIDNSPESIGKFIDIIINQNENEYIKQRNNAYTLAKSFDVFTNVDNWIDVLNKLSK